MLDGRMGVDYGLHVILTGEPTSASLEEIPEIVRAGHADHQDVHRRTAG